MVGQYHSAIIAGSCLAHHFPFCILSPILINPQQLIPNSQCAQWWCNKPVQKDLIRPLQSQTPFTGRIYLACLYLTSGCRQARIQHTLIDFPASSAAFWVTGGVGGLWVMMRQLANGLMGNEGPACCQPTVRCWIKQFFGCVLYQ